jgi:mannan endo-1,4-beta-mannosidase
MHITASIVLGLATLGLTAPNQPVDVGKRAWITYNNIDPNANAQAKALLKFLQNQFGWHYLSGQQDISSLARLPPF